MESKQTTKPFYKCRRTLIALVGILSCVAIAFYNKIDTSGAIAMIVISIAGANAAQSVFTKEKPNAVAP